MSELKRFMVKPDLGPCWQVFDRLRSEVQSTWTTRKAAREEAHHQNVTEWQRANEHAA